MRSDYHSVNIGRAVIKKRTAVKVRDWRFMWPFSIHLPPIKMIFITTQSLTCHVKSAVGALVRMLVLFLCLAFVWLLLGGTWKSTRLGCCLSITWVRHSRYEDNSVTPRVAHTWYRMQGCVVHRGIKTVGREPSWCRLNSEYHNALAPFLIPI